MNTSPFISRGFSHRLGSRMYPIFLQMKKKTKVKPFPYDKEAI